MSKVYVGNLSWATTDESLNTAFSPYGKIESAKVERDRDTNRSRGFGIITYSTADEAIRAIDAMNGSELDGRRIRVNLANQKPNGGGSSSTSGGGYSSGYSSGSYNGGYRSSGY